MLIGQGVRGTASPMYEDDFYCNKCKVWRVREDDYRLTCPICADLTYAMTYPSDGGNQPMSETKEDFASFLRFFGGRDGRVAPLHELERVLGKMVPNFNVTNVYEELDTRYKKYSAKVHSILLISIEASKLDLDNVPKVEALFKSMGLKKKDFGDIAPKVLRLSGFAGMRYLTPEQEEDILNHVGDIREIWSQVSGGRKYFLSYKYVLYKICQMRGYTEFLRDIELPSGKTLRSSDTIWARICDRLHYPYYPSTQS